MIAAFLELSLPALSSTASRPLFSRATVPPVLPAPPHPVTGNDLFYSLKYIALGFPMDKQLNTVVKNTVFI